MKSIVWIAVLFLFVVKVHGACLSQCECFDEGGRWVAVCDHVPKDIMRSSGGIDVLKIVTCPTDDFFIPEHMQLEVSSLSLSVLIILVLSLRSRGAISRRI